MIFVTSVVTLKIDGSYFALIPTSNRKGVSLFSDEPILIRIIPGGVGTIHDSRHFFFGTYVNSLAHKSFSKTRFPVIHSP